HFLGGNQGELDLYAKDAEVPKNVMQLNAGILLQSILRRKALLRYSGRIINSFDGFPFFSANSLFNFSVPY
ncbi:MAG: hypothetical protein DRQ24_11525, partial [Candidatus Latescibacterota bacterium]